VNLLHEPQLEDGAAGLGLEFLEVALELPLLASLAQLMHKFQNLPWALQNRKVSACTALSSLNAVFAWQRKVCLRGCAVTHQGTCTGMGHDICHS